MGFRIKFTNQAALDLSKIVEYIRDELYSPKAAEHFYHNVDKKLKKIRENPLMYPLSQDELLRAKGYHTVVIGNYLLFYLINEDTNIIYISRIIYSKRDLTAIHI